MENNLLMWGRLTFMGELSVDVGRPNADVIRPKVVVGLVSFVFQSHGTVT